MTNLISASDIDWKIIEFDQNLSKKISRKYNISLILSDILVSRNICDNDIENYLSPKIKNLLPNPFDLSNLEIAVNFIYKAIIERKKITIFGDYDVDGATSSAILKSFFTDINYDINIYIPDRVKEGYGPNKNAFKYIKEQGSDIVITVDCGASSHDVVDYANSINLDVIIIDHHIGSKINPNAIAVINPNSYNEKFKYKNLCAAAVVYLFIIALNKKLRNSNYYNNLNEPNIFNYLDLVALGTICDVMKLDLLNRAFVYQGLKIINNKINKGILSLINIANINDIITSYHLGYIIGPRINAGGRIGRSYLGSKILSSNCQNEIDEIALSLNNYNNERKIIEATAIDEAIQFIENNNIYNNEQPVILAYSYDWHQGIIGIIASRIKDKYNKPTVIITFDKQDNIGKASCRSIAGIDLGSLIIKACEENILLNGGGHAMAGGFTINYNNLEYLHKYWCSIIKDDVLMINANRTKYYDVKLYLENINLELVTNINKIEPYGVGNPKPRFLIPDVRIANFKYIGSDKSHISCILTSKSNFKSQSLKAIAFNCINSNIEKFIISNNYKKIDIIATININYWQGNKNIQIIIEDILLTK